MTDPLPVPSDDGACDHLPGRRLPVLDLPSSEGGTIRLSELPSRTVVFVYPAIGGPDVELLVEWTLLPGARGCTPEACGFRDELSEFDALGARVVGLSGQQPAVQRRHREELHLPYPLLSDAELSLAEDPGLPVFDFHRTRYFKRATLIVGDGAIEHVLYPVFPPQDAAAQALEWLRGDGCAPR